MDRVWRVGLLLVTAAGGAACEAAPAPEPARAATVPAPANLDCRFEDLSWGLPAETARDYLERRGFRAPEVPRERHWDRRLRWESVVGRVFGTDATIRLGYGTAARGLRRVLVEWPATRADGPSLENRVRTELVGRLGLPTDESRSREPGPYGPPRAYSLWIHPGSCAVSMEGGEFYHVEYGFVLAIFGDPADEATAK
jgi:hypothetical protein